MNNNNEKKYISVTALNRYISYKFDMDNNLIKNINEVSAGDIIYVSPNSALPKLKVLLNEISRVDLEITYLSKLISEEN